MRSPFLPLILLSLAIGPVQAQSGSGAPGAYFAIKGPVIGIGASADFGFPGPGPLTVIMSVSDGYGPSIHPLLGQVWLEVNSPLYQNIPYSSDANGNVHLSLALPFDPALFTSTPLFVNAFVMAPSIPTPGWSLSKTVRYQPESQDGYNPVGPMNEPRFLHSVTSLAHDSFSDESRVLVAGGGIGNLIIQTPSQTSEIYNPMKRAFELGPLMGIPRGAHQAVLMDDGRVLICGGVSTSGLVTPTCEIFDPQLNVFLPANPMINGRTGHRATVLDDGRVLVAGGFASWVNAGANFVNVLNTSQDTAEIYDPATGNWTQVAQTLITNRSGHTQTRLPDGRVLLAAGVTGGAITGTGLGVGQVPTYTATAEIFDPATNTFTPTGNLGTARGFHAASVLADGSVLATAGTAGLGSFSAAVAITSCEVWDGASWSAAPALPTTASFHYQVESNWNSDAIILGGYTGDLTTLSGSAKAYRHNGSLVFATMDIGTHAHLPGNAAVPLGDVQAALLHNGTYLVCGGAHESSVSDLAWIIAEN